MLFVGIVFLFIAQASSEGKSTSKYVDNQLSVFGGNKSDNVAGAKTETGVESPTPSPTPSPEPTAKPTSSPTLEPTLTPTAEPTAQPNANETS